MTSVFIVPSTLWVGVGAILSAAHPVNEIRSAQTIIAVKFFAFIVGSPLNYKNTNRPQNVQRESEKILELHTLPESGHILILLIEAFARVESFILTLNLGELLLVGFQHLGI